MGGKWEANTVPRETLLPVTLVDDQTDRYPRLELRANDTGYWLVRYDEFGGLPRGSVSITEYHAKFLKESIAQGIRPTWNWIHG